VTDRHTGKKKIMKAFISVQHFIKKKKKRKKKTTERILSKERQFQNKEVKEKLK
jgi:hypothetical protein